jgi:hypothetical protein
MVSQRSQVGEASDGDGVSRQRAMARPAYQRGGLLRELLRGHAHGFRARRGASRARDCMSAWGDVVKDQGQESGTGLTNARLQFSLFPDVHTYIPSL